jgi:protein-tyrosine kinase
MLTGKSMQTMILPSRDADFAEVTDLTSARRLLGELLIDAGTLTAPEVERILAEQTRTGQRFGQAARSLGLADSQEIDQALSRQFDCPYLPASDRSFSSKLATAYRPFGPIGESMRALRSRLMMRWFSASQPHKALAVLGVERGVGRSFVTANLAVVFAQTGERTLLIDGNLQRPSQHLMFKIQNPKRRSALLATQDSIQEIARFPAFPELAVLPAGAVAANSQGNIAPERFSALLAEVAREFDVILVDTPAASESADAQAIALRTQGAVLVARSGKTPTDQLAELDDSLQHAGVTLMGLVFNER